MPSPIHGLLQSKKVAKCFFQCNSKFSCHYLILVELNTFKTTSMLKFGITDEAVPKMVFAMIWMPIKSELMTCVLISIRLTTTITKQRNKLMLFDSFLNWKTQQLFRFIMYMWFKPVQRDRVTSGIEKSNSWPENHGTQEVADFEPDVNQNGFFLEKFLERKIIITFL